MTAHRVVKHAKIQARVVAYAAPGGEHLDREEGLDVRRVPRARRRRLSVIRLNAASVPVAMRFRPDIVLSLHVVTAPAAWLVGRMLRRPFIQYFHADETARRSRLSRFAARRAAHSIVVSRHSRELAVVAGAPVERLSIITPGVDPYEGPRLPRDDRPTVVTVGRLEDEYKGHDVLIHALKHVQTQVPAARLVIVGDGWLRPPLEDLAEELAVSDSVVFAGQVSDDERDAWLDRAHVFAMPSRLPADRSGGEGFGIVYLEAGVHGLPVVAGAVGGALDAVIDGETGLLVDPEDPVAVGEALAALLLDPARAAELGEAGRERALASSWEVVAAATEELLLEVCREWGVGGPG